MRHATALAMTVALAVTAAARPAAAAEPAFVEWSSAFSDGLPADWGYNVFDGKEGTAWCSAENPGDEMLTLGFIGEQEVTEVGVLVGALTKGKLDPTRGRVREMVVRDGRTKVTLSLRDKPEVQYIKLNPTLIGSKLTFTITMAYPGEDRSSPICVSEIVLKHDGATVTGDALGTKIRSLTGPKAALVHTWVDQPGAAERTLILGLGGSFLWSYESNLGDKPPLRLYGTWSLHGERIGFNPKNGKAASLKVRHDRVASGDKLSEQIVLEGTGLAENFAGTYYKLTP
ncbi:MAG: discoidin domain-containing protein [Deltaproteobacteria bacterium]|nr:discoidin domain-containing protein [Deltaproteobacteria bacterium]